jgi:hypothetical protein
MGDAIFVAATLPADPLHGQAGTTLSKHNEFMRMPPADAQKNACHNACHTVLVRVDGSESHRRTMDTATATIAL